MAVAVGPRVRAGEVVPESDTCSRFLVEDLMAQTYAGLMGMKNFGEKTLSEVRAAVAALGLTPPAWQRPPAPRKTPRPRAGRNKSIVELWR